MRDYLIESNIVIQLNKTTTTSLLTLICENQN